MSTERITGAHASAPTQHADDAREDALREAADVRDVESRDANSTPDAALRNADDARENALRNVDDAREVVLSHANAMPAITWHRMHLNDTDITLPAGLDCARGNVESASTCALGTPGEFEHALSALQARLADAHFASGTREDTRAITRAVRENIPADNLDVPALSTYERRAVESELARDVAADFETGMGPDARAWLLAAAGDDPAKRLVFVAKAGSTSGATVRVSAAPQVASAAAIDLVAEPDSTLTVEIALDAAADETNAADIEDAAAPVRKSAADIADAAGVAGIALRVFAGARAKVRISTIQTLDEGFIALNDTGAVLDEDARVSVRHVELGASASYTGLACDLRSDAADLAIDTRYVGAGKQVRDFNYVVRHRGKKTTCNLDAKGVLLGSAQKTLRGTIDLVHGCKGAQGSEQETVVLADERVANRTVPVILCDEDDVAGNHGATIGHVRPEQLFYLESRGLSAEAAEALFASATFEEAALHTVDDRTRASIKRVAHAQGVAFEEVL